MQTLLPDERWTQIEALFQEAADLQPASREAFLQERYGDDPQLRDEVLSLLRYDTGVSPVTTESPLLDALQASAASLVADAPSAGRMLGPYRIEREIGRGGMSVVYLAARADGEFRKRVAIKLIKRGMDTQAVVERFRRERRILAALEHPAIARLLDGGTTADGLPWIAMEYVEGLPIHRYCLERKLSVEAICRLFDKVCDAVAYAHRSLVVHRDLKPSNILVAPDGNPKLLDFGIAKLLDDADESPDGPLTRGQTRPLTPEYASPEQLRGGAVGTSSDVYSLGVVLYELLAGRRPDKNEPASLAALRLGRDPGWAKRLTGDLDTILQKALQAEPERRYLTVEQFQSDIRRHLAGLPVSARAETWRYRFGKFLRRHPIATPVVAAAALVAIVAAVLIVRAEKEAQVQREKSDQRLGQLVALANTTLFDVNGTDAKQPGATQARLEIVRKTLASLDSLNTESGNDVRVQAALASAYERAALLQGSPLQPNLGDRRGAEQSFTKALAVLSTALARADTPALDVQEVSVRNEFGTLLSDVGRRDEALVQFRRARDLAVKIITREPGNLEAHKLGDDAQIDIGQITKYTDPPGTRDAAMKLLPSLQAQVRDHPSDADGILRLASLWSLIGSTFDRESKNDQALDSFRKSAALREKLYALRPRDTQVQHDLLIAYGHLGDITGSPLFVGAYDYRGGVVWYRKAAAIAAKMAEADPSNVQARSDEGVALARVGSSLEAAGDDRAALDSFRQAEALLGPLFAASPENQSLAERVSLLYLFRGRSLLKLGDNPHALDSLERVVSVCRVVLKAHTSGQCQLSIWTGTAFLASSLAAAGRLDEALREADEAIKYADRARSISSPNAGKYAARAFAAQGDVRLAMAKRASGADRAAQFHSAAESFRNALASWRKVPAEEKRSCTPELHHAEAGLAEATRASKAP